MEILQQKRTRANLMESAEVLFDGEMIKAVVDIRRQLLAIDAGKNSAVSSLMTIYLAAALTVCSVILISSRCFPGDSFYSLCMYGPCVSHGHVSFAS